MLNLIFNIWSKEQVTTGDDTYLPFMLVDKDVFKYYSFYESSEMERFCWFGNIWNLCNEFN